MHDQRRHRRGVLSLLVLLVCCNVDQQGHADDGLLDGIRIFELVAHVLRPSDRVHLPVGAALVFHAGPQIGDGCGINLVVRRHRISDKEGDAEAFPLSTTTTTFATAPTLRTAATANLGANEIDSSAVLVQDLVLGDEDAHVADILRGAEQIAVGVLRLQVR